MLTPQNLPWKVVDTGYDGVSTGRNAKVLIVDCNDQPVAVCGYPGAPHPQDVQNAEAIVATVNLHRPFGA